MELVLLQNEATDNIQSENATTELSEMQLALVGGGSADVILA